MRLRDLDPVQFGKVFEELFFEKVLSEIGEMDDMTQNKLARAAFGDQLDSERKWYRIKNTSGQGRKQRLWVADAAALVLALGHDPAGFVVLVSQAAAERLGATQGSSVKLRLIASDDGGISTKQS